MYCYKSLYRNSGGFSLIQVGIMLAVAAVLLAAFLPGKEAADTNYKINLTTQRMQKIDAAMKGYMAAHGARPCPANGQYAVDDQYFGVAADNTNGTCIGNTPAAPLTYTYGSSPDDQTVVGGTVPTATLGLPDEYGIDGWGRRITYVVDVKATVNATCEKLQGDDVSRKGHVDIKGSSGQVKDSVMYALISHGPDGHGAWPAKGSTVSERFNSQSTDTDTWDNASVSDGNFSTDFDNVFVQKDSTSGFDDIVYYSHLKNTCCIGGCRPPSPASLGFVIYGEDEPSATGFSLATGDINGDGIDDMVIGAPLLGSGDGAVYVVFGDDSAPFPNPFLLAKSPTGLLTISNGFRVAGPSTELREFGHSVAVGDVNQDGKSDIIIGAPGSLCIVGGTKVYVIYGRGDSFASWDANTTFESLDMLSGSDGFTITGDGSNIGQAVASGNINGDNYDDVLMAGDGVYAVFGSASPVDLDVTLDLDGFTGFSLNGRSVYADTAGTPLAIGNINGDNYEDIALADLSGDVYVVFGQADWTAGAGVYDPAYNGSDGFIADFSAQSLDATSVSFGNINGDYPKDLIMASTNNIGTSARAYVLFGKLSGWAASLDLATLINNVGFYIDGLPNGNYPIAATTTGDLNEDGFDEVVFSQSWATSYDDITQGGAVFLVFGKNDWTGVNTIDALADLGASSTLGFHVFNTDISLSHSQDMMGMAMAMGDVNGDGHGKELLISAPLADPDVGSKIGVVHVISGDDTVGAWAFP